MTMPGRSYPSPPNHAPGSGASQWLLGFLLVAAIAALFLALQLFQATSEGPAKQALRRSTAAVTEIDALIERNYDDLQRRAEASQRGESLQLSGYPIEVPLDREEALGISKDDLRQVLLDRSTDLMYSKGTSVFRDPDQATSDAGPFTAAGAVDNALGLLRNGVHDIVAVLTVALAALCIALALALAAACRGFGRLTAIGAAVLTASLPLLLISLAVRAYMGNADGEGTEYIERELLSIGESLAWIPVRNGIAFTALGAILLLAGVVFGRWSEGRASARHFAIDR